MNQKSIFIPSVLRDFPARRLAFLNRYLTEHSNGATAMRSILRELAKNDFPYTSNNLWVLRECVDICRHDASSGDVILRALKRYRGKINDVLPSLFRPHDSTLMTEAYVPDVFRQHDTVFIRGYNCNFSSEEAVNARIWYYPVDSSHAAWMLARAIRCYVESLDPSSVSGARSHLESHSSNSES